MLSMGIRIHTNLLHVCIQRLCGNNANKREKGTELGVFGAGLTEAWLVLGLKLRPQATGKALNPSRIQKVLKISII